jgi:hypothetical protein
MWCIQCFKFYILLCNGKVTNALGLGGLVKAHSKLL